MKSMNEETIVLGSPDGNELAKDDGSELDAPLEITLGPALGIRLGTELANCKGTTNREQIYDGDRHFVKSTGDPS
jgi:hypothetical protein